MSLANLDSADLKGVDFGGLINEDVMQAIWDISEVPLPVTQMIGSDVADNSYTEWTLDKLADVNLDNAVVDGADTITLQDTSVGTRVGNQCQISVKVVKVSTRARQSDSIGTSDQLARQVMRRQQELRRDVEAIMLSEQGSVADDGNTTPGRAGGLSAWLTSNTDNGGTGADGGFSSGVVSPATPGTARALSEATVRDVAESIWLAGGDPSVLTSVPKAIRAFSEHMFSGNAGIAGLTSDVREKESAAIATGAVNVLVTDYGVNLSFLPNRLQQDDPTTANTATVYLLDPEYLRLAYLHGYRVEDLSKTGLADNRQMAVDWTLKVLNQEAHGAIRAIDYTLPATA